MTKMEGRRGERGKRRRKGEGKREPHIALPAWKSQLFLSQSRLSTHQMLSLLCPSPQVSAPEKGIIFIALGCLPNPTGRDGKKGKRLPHPQSPGETLARENWGLTPTLPLHLCLLRMCLPDILCPRFSPEGPECPARTEDSPRGEFCALQGQGLRRVSGVAGGLQPSQDTELFSTSCHQWETLLASFPSVDVWKRRIPGVDGTFSEGCMPPLPHSSVRPQATLEGGSSCMGGMDSRLDTCVRGSSRRPGTLLWYWIRQAGWL